MTKSSNILIQKLDEFIRRYYKDRLIRGSIYATSILLAAFLTVVLLEYFGEFNQVLRGVLFFSFLTATVVVVTRYIVIPLLKLNRIGDVITYDQAAVIVGNHFPNVEDKLLNVLQLQSKKHLVGSDDLLLAGINQKINELKTVPFSSVIRLENNVRYLRYVLPPLFLTMVMVFVWPHIISKGTTRLVNYSTYYEKEMPFRFHLQNEKLQVLQSQNFELVLKVTGEELPAEVYVSVNNIEYKMEKLSRNAFRHVFPNVQNTTDFQLGAAGFMSHKYSIEVLPRPTLTGFQLQLQYPAYLHKPNEAVSNTGDLQIPAGTKVTWILNTRNADNMQLKFADSMAEPKQVEKDRFQFSRRFTKNNLYTILPQNHFVKGAVDSVSYSINVIPDQYPAIDIFEQKDSLNPRQIYLSGQVRDDYGFTRLSFHYKRKGTDSTGRQTENAGVVPLSFKPDKISQPYFHFLDLSQFELGAGEQLEYFVEVHDNDGVSGPKSSRTQLLTFKAPTRDELNQATDRSNSEIKKDLEESMKKARQLQKDINELSKKINEKKQLGYEEKKKLEELLNKQKELENKINEIKNENEQNNKQQSEFSQVDESILEKQKQLEQLFENVMTPEMKKLFDELNKMLEKFDKNQVQEKLEELKLSNKDIEKELDRNLEAFKQLEVQQKMQQALEKLQELKEKEDQLSKETESGDDKKAQDKEQAGEKKPGEKPEEKSRKQQAEELSKKQQDISKEFEELKKDLKELNEKNAALEEPNKMPDQQQLQEEISKDMQESSEQLGKNNKKSAAKSQKSASEKMDKMQQSLEQAMNEAEQEQSEENAQTLRQILENLVNLSFAQEELIKQLPNVRADNPQFVNIPKQQNKLKDDSKIIEDSLLALSKRAPQISALVNREISAINLNMDKTVRSLAERNTGESLMRMQSTMTSVNNLALLLNESLEQMQQQMQQQAKSQSQKGGKCKKPGKASGQNPSPNGSQVGNMRKLQEQLNKQLQELKEAMEKGEKPGNKPGDKNGQKPGQGMKPGGVSGGMMPGNSEQFAKMAAQQEAIRRQIASLMEKLKNKGANPGGDLTQMMEETEKELVNKQITNATLRRQQEILTRLLESEKAEKEREQDEQRKSNEAKNEKSGNPPEFLEYKRLKEKEMELLNTVPPALTPYYKEKVNIYFNSINKE